MSVSEKEYQQMSKKASPPSPAGKDCVKAFVVGGLFCVLGEVMFQVIGMTGLEEKTARMLASVTLIFLAVALTGLQVFDNLAKHAGAGTLVPITGFANSIAAPAIEFKSEGYILGLGAKMFAIAGPVLVFGTLASVIYGIIYWVTTLF